MIVQLIGTNRTSHCKNRFIGKTFIPFQNPIWAVQSFFMYFLMHQQPLGPSLKIGTRWPEFFRKFLRSYYLKLETRIFIPFFEFTNRLYYLRKYTKSFCRTYCLMLLLFFLSSCLYLIYTAVPWMELLSSFPPTFHFLENKFVTFIYFPYKFPTLPFATQSFLTLNTYYIISTKKKPSLLLSNPLPLHSLATVLCYFFFVYSFWSFFKAPFLGALILIRKYVLTKNTNLTSKIIKENVSWSFFLRDMSKAYFVFILGSLGPVSYRCKVWRFIWDIGFKLNICSKHPTLTPNTKF